MMAKFARRQRSRQRATAMHDERFQWLSHLEIDLSRVADRVARDTQEVIKARLFEGLKWNGRAMKRAKPSTIRRKLRAAAPFPVMVRTGYLARSLRVRWVPRLDSLRLSTLPFARERLRMAFRSRRVWWKPGQREVDHIRDEFVRAGLLVEKPGAP